MVPKNFGAFLQISKLSLKHFYKKVLFQHICMTFIQRCIVVDSMLPRRYTLSGTGSRISIHVQNNRHCRIFRSCNAWKCARQIKIHTLLKLMGNLAFLIIKSQTVFFFSILKPSEDSEQSALRRRLFSAFAERWYSKLHHFLSLIINEENTTNIIWCTFSDEKKIHTVYIHLHICLYSVIKMWLKATK